VFSFSLTNAFLIKAKKRPKHEGGLLHDFTLHVFVSNYFAAVGINVKITFQGIWVPADICVHEQDNKISSKKDVKNLCIVWRVTWIEF
jgi:hypothetical protein